MEELQLRLLEKTAHDIVFWGGKKVAPSKKIIALNMYIGTNVLVYESWLVLRVCYMLNAFTIP